MDAQKPPTTLYHYTSIEGLIGILQNKNIWATSIFHLNDKEELILARKLFVDAISKYRDEILSPEEKLLINDVIQILNNFSKDYPIFVTSFSAAENQLSQWRAYCPRGNGFMIGFDSYQIENILGPGARLVKCKYEEKEQRDFVDGFIREKIILRKVNSEEEEFDSFRIVSEIIEILPILKNKFFIDEEEWRIIVELTHDQLAEIKFRAGKTVPIPFIELDLKNESGRFPIHSIMIGPTPNKDEAFKSIDLFKYREDLKNLIIMDSKIPYREI